MCCARAVAVGMALADKHPKLFYFCVGSNQNQIYSPITKVIKDYKKETNKENLKAR